MQLQNVDTAKTLLARIISRGNTTYLSTLFRNLRDLDRLSSYGDYPLLAYAIRTAKDFGLTFQRREVLTALNQSEELSAWNRFEKSELVEQLLNPA